MSLTTLEAHNDFTGKARQSSYSALTLHRKCPQAWLYRYGMGLEAIEDTPTPYLTIGRWWSVLQAAESLTRGRTTETLVLLPRKLRDRDEGYDLDPKTVAVGDVMEASKIRWRSMTRDEQDAFTTALGATLPERLDHMLKTWDAANEQRFEREQVLGAEVFWERELPRPEKDAAWSLLADPQGVPSMKLVGFVDEVYYDRERRMVVIKDGKAQKDIDRGNSALDDLMDSQLQLYAWGLAPTLKEVGYSAPRAVSFDRIRSVHPREPQLTAAGGLSKAVTAYDAATYRRWATTDTRPSDDEIEHSITDADGNWSVEKYEELKAARDQLEPGRMWGKFGEYYITGAKKGQPKFGIYDLDEKVLAALAQDTEKRKWSNRVTDPVNRRVIEAHLRAAVDTALDIYQTQQRAAATGAAARNLDRRGCSFCDFADLCRSQLIGGSVGEYDLDLYGLRKKPTKQEKKA